MCKIYNVTCWIQNKLNYSSNTEKVYTWIVQTRDAI